jgi:hypothetical protein
MNCARGVPLTGLQRGVLASLRLRNPRAAVSIPARQYELPVVRFRFRGATAAPTVELWIDPRGRCVKTLRHGRPR